MALNTKTFIGIGMLESKLNAQLAAIDKLLLSLGGISIQEFLDTHEDTVVSILIMDTPESKLVKLDSGITLHYVKGKLSPNQIRGVVRLGVYCNRQVTDYLSTLLHFSLSTAQSKLKDMGDIGVGCCVFDTAYSVDYTKPDAVVKTIEQFKHTSYCLHWGMRVGKSRVIQETFIKGLISKGSRVIAVIGHVEFPEEASFDKPIEVQGFSIVHHRESSSTLLYAKTLDALNLDVVTDVIIDDAEWLYKSFEIAKAEIELALHRVKTKGGHALIAGTQNLGVLDACKDSFDVYSKITTPEVLDIGLLNVCEDKFFKRDFLLELE